MSAIATALWEDVKNWKSPLRYHILFLVTFLALIGATFVTFEVNRILKQYHGEDKVAVSVPQSQTLIDQELSRLAMPQVEMVKSMNENLRTMSENNKLINENNARVIAQLRSDLTALNQDWQKLKEEETNLEAKYSQEREARISAEAQRDLLEKQASQAQEKTKPYSIQSNTNILYLHETDTVLRFSNGARANLFVDDYGHSYYKGKDINGRRSWIRYQ